MWIPSPCVTQRNGFLLVLSKKTIHFDRFLSTYLSALSGSGVGVGSGKCVPLMSFMTYGMTAHNLDYGFEIVHGNF